MWKAIEASDDGNEKYRVLVNFETRPKRTDNQQRNPNGTVKDVSPPGEAEPSRPPQNDDGFEAQTFNDLDSRTKAKAARALREAGIAFPRPAEADINKVHSIIDAVVGE